MNMGWSFVWLIHGVSGAKKILHVRMPFLWYPFLISTQELLDIIHSFSLRDYSGRDVGVQLQYLYMSHHCI